MKITAIELTNVRGFRRLAKTIFSESINIFVGPNNSGKSTIISSIFMLQRRGLIQKTDITIGAANGVIDVYANGQHSNLVIKDNDVIRYNLTQEKMVKFNLHTSIETPIATIPETEPLNLFYPFLSKRKTTSFSDQINESTTNIVSGNFQNLFAKIDRIITPQYLPGNTKYIKACNEILGFEISSLASPGGKKGVYFVHNQEHIPLTAMGEGVANIIALIIDLCVAENKIFLIEEPENDIHPTALKALLRLIIEASDKNQFFISTHSNIVMKYLGGEQSSKIFSFESTLSDTKRPNLYLSTMNEVKTEEERRQTLENLGYELNDMGIWEAWLFLEESSAEVLIREWFIKWFIPTLIGKLRTFSSNSLYKVKPKFEDFNTLFVYLHLEPAYKNKAWVIVDAGDDELKVLSEMKDVYMKSGWDEIQFQQFSEHDFEKYYPQRFQQQVDVVLKGKNKEEKRKQKKILLEEVKQWISENEGEAKKEFKESAKDVIDKLKMIEKVLKSKTI